jgi:heat shock protein HtpX
VSDDAVNLFAQQEANRRRSRWLMIGFVLFFAWLGFGGDVIAYLGTNHQYRFPLLGLVLTALAAGLAWFSWTTGPERVLWSTGAREVKTPATPEERQLVNVVEEMAIASGLPRPRIWIVPDPDPNAFATGRDEQTASVAVTEGLLALCSRDELQGVIGHELGHVRNLDVRLMTLLAALVGAVALLSDGVGRVMRSGGSVRVDGRSGGRGKGNDLGPLVIVLLVLWILSWLLAPVILRLMSLGVSRKREYLADAMSAQFTRNPMALASALEKIEDAEAPTKCIKGGAAHLCIADPLGRRLNGRQGALAELLGTHPPMAMRVARLKAMAYQELTRGGQLAPAVEGAAG